MKKQLLALLLALVMALSLTACGGDDKEKAQQDDRPAAHVMNAGSDESWAIYWYLCGSDLETEWRLASMDLFDLTHTDIPGNIKVVIQTGGASEWHDKRVDSGKLQRWLYDSSGLKLVDEQKNASMGDAQTLADFLSFASSNYPADRTAVVFWNHGGGSVRGVAFDENYDMDSLDLDEMYRAFDAVWPANAKNPPIEMVGFDACLMGTVDVAAVFRNFARYMVASEEVVPGSGWDYADMMAALAADPGMDGEEFGIMICNTFYEDCERVDNQGQVTMSLTDLTKLQPLLDAYEAFGQEAFVTAAKEPGFFAELGRAATQCENYGGNTKEQGYTNMVDLGHLARQTAWMLPSAQSVSDALAECVVHQVKGEYRAEATGLSCYYPYSGTTSSLNGYISLGASDSFKYLYSYGITGEMPQGGREYLSSLSIHEYSEIMTLNDMDWDGMPLDVDDTGTAYLTLGPQAADILAGIGYTLIYVDEENDTMLLLGTDNDIGADWENGVFYDNFQGYWGAIDDNLVYMELSFEGEDYNLYSVPILLNGEGYNLRVVYDFSEQAWSILGASPGLDDSGMGNKEIRKLKNGDEITIIWKLATYSGDDGFEMYEVDTMTVTSSTSFGMMPLIDGRYFMVMEMRDAMGNYAHSEPVIFDCSNGRITTSVTGS